MPVQIAFRDADEIADQLDDYAARHDMPDRQSVVRLAVRQLLKGKPPKTMPEGVLRTAGNPDPAAAGQAGAAARWGKPKQRRRKKPAADAKAAVSSGR